ncbi:MAG: hypothetical protein JWO38_4887 [Gemmataceae bacterium]|nr:hypothetical protein [Gemmataceae bacterium]
MKTSERDLWYRLWAHSQRDESRRRTAIEELWRLAYRSPIVKTFLTAWQSGGFNSFEDALAALCVELAEQNAHFQEAGVKMAMARNEALLSAFLGANPADDQPAEPIIIPNDGK